MFKLESYITPLLMGYLDKYVKLRQEDFQLSLWGGDAVLNNLDLRLNELEKVIQLPVMFQSGHIHELRLHVPWTKLGSEPVVITINTVECILKVRDTAYDGSSATQPQHPSGSSVQQKQKSRRHHQPAEELPPGYLQSIVKRIINNVTFIINNLIIKFVEDDIVLSVNVKSAECYSVDKEWNRAFVDLTADDLALRKVVNFADLTVCLDKTNASGHIESYQEPMAYRCAVTCRLHMEYDSTSAKYPRVTRFNLYCDNPILSLTDTQLPMFVRLIELFIAMYYGTLDIPTSTTGSHTGETSVDPVSEDSLEPQSSGFSPETDPASDQGWASWAWSYVPSLLPTEEEAEEMERLLAEQARKGKPAAHILSIGFYIHQGSIVFKVTEKARDSSELPHKKIHFHPFLRLNVEGVGIEVLLQGITFCNIQCGMTSFSLTTCGNCICGVADEKVARSNVLLSGGESLDNKIGLTYISNSLFDDLSWENRGQRAQHIVDGEEHQKIYTEQNALQKYGAFWVDSLYTYEKPEKHGAGSNSSETDHSDSFFLKEFSTLRFVFGNTNLQFSSTLYHRVMLFIHCAQNHQYQPYGSSKPSMTSATEERPKPTEEQVRSLEEFIPTQLMHLMFINPTVTILSTEHPECDVAKKNYKSRHRKRDSKTSEEHHHPPPLPAAILSASRFDLQVTKPMYPGRLVKIVTAIAGPSSNLLHHCHSHTQIKLFSLQMGLQKVTWDKKVSPTLTLVPPCSFALYLRSLLLPKLWTNSSLPLKEWMYEIPSASVNINKASVLMCSRILSSWLASPDRMGAENVLEDSLLDDLFPVSGESTHQSYPLLEVGLHGLEFKSCESALVVACTGSLSLLHVFLYTPGIGGKMSVIPILYGPNDTSHICDPEFFKQPTLDKVDVRSDCITVTLQKPKQTCFSEAQALALLDCQGFCVWLDPGLISWFHYCPQPRLGEKVPISLDLSLAQMTSPLNAVSQASVRSTSSPSHQERSHQQTSTSQPPQGRQTSIAEETDKEQKQGNGEKDSLGETLAQYFPLVRMLHVQIELKPSAIFLPKTGVPNSESNSDILTIIHQARHAGRLSDTVVICVPTIVVTSTMTKPMSVVQDLPVTSIQGSLIGEKLPWTVKVNNICIYSLLSSRPDPLFLVHPVDILSTVAITCKYNPPTSEIISSLALCLHMDVEQPKIDVTAVQLQLCSTITSMISSVASNANKLACDILKPYLHKHGGKTRSSPRSPRAPTSHKKSVASTNKVESVRSAEVTENITTDISEDFSHEGSPLHESIIDDLEETGIKLSLWLQLMIPRLNCTLYNLCPTTHKENGIALNLDHFDLSMDSQNVYSKAKITLGSISINHSVKSIDGTWSWTDPESIVLSFVKQLPRNLHTVTTKMWIAENNTPVSFAQPHEAADKDKKHGVLSMTFTRALCKNVKKRLRKANVDLPSVSELDPVDCSVRSDNTGSMRHHEVEYYFHEYLSEVCLKMEPFDLVLKPELVEIVLGLFHGLAKEDKRGKIPTATVKHDLFVPSPLRQDKSETSSVHNLPLIYADLGAIRLFLPKSNFMSNVDDTEEKLQTSSGIKKPRNMQNADQAEPSTDGTEKAVTSTIINIDMDMVAPDCGVEPQVILQSTPNLRNDSKVQPLVPQVNRQSTNSCIDSGVADSHTETPSTLNHDMLVVQMNSCLLQPHADNPLPRTPQEKEIFLHAVQAGFTLQPGAVIEDRQYQVDVKGVSLSTGLWDQVVTEAKKAEWRKSPSGSLVQIPALDWNTFLMDSPAQEKRDIKLIPLATPFDLCFVVAPPITYVAQHPEPGLERWSKLICSFTSELNLTSDLDLYLSTSQVKLLSDITTQFTQSFSSKSATIQPQGALSSPSPLAFHDSRKRTQQTPELLGGMDSGVESDLSTLTLDRGHLGTRATQRQSSQLKADAKRALGLTEEDKREDENVGPLAIMPPLDILVTAGRISCTVYSHKTLDEDIVLELPLFRERHSNLGQPSKMTTDTHHVSNVRDNLAPVLNKAAASSRCTGRNSRDSEENEDSSDVNEEPFTTFNFMKAPEESFKKVVPKGSVCIIPFVYLYITQPHCIVANHSKDDIKMEVSCHDVLVKGASDRHVSSIDEYHVIPDSADFNIHWLETRAGQPHPHTGIPPSLLTARFVKEMSIPDTVSIVLDRPVRLKMSQLAVEQMMSFYTEMTAIFPSPPSNECEKTQALNETPESRKKETQFDVLSLAERLEMRSTQIVVAMEMSDIEASLGVILSTEGTTLEADVNREVFETNPTVTAHVQMKDIVAKTIYKKKTRPLIGPLTVNLDACFSQIPLSGSRFMSQSLFAVETNLIPIIFGQEHLFCLAELVERVNTMVENIARGRNSYKAETFSPTAAAKSDTKFMSSKGTTDFVQDRTHDDLRCGTFTFIEDPEGSTLQPDANEIIVSRGDSETQENSSMSWCYPQPRVVTHLNMTPVPFCLSSSNMSLDSSTSGAASVPCMLQYLDDLTGDFVDVIDFHLSENEPVSVPMQEAKPVNATELIAAKVWRVVLLQFSNENQDQKFSADAAVLPASLAACMCVDSAFIPSLIPTLQLSVSVPVAEIRVCNHMEYNGSDVPKKLSQYTVYSEAVDDQIFAVLKIGNLNGIFSHKPGSEINSSLKLTMQTGLDILEFGHLTMEDVLQPIDLVVTTDLSRKGNKQDISASIKANKIRLKVGRSCMHTINMAVAAWTSFNPSSTGSHLILTKYVICNKTASTIRFGQAGTDENIVLDSRGMYPYSWRTYTSDEMIHLCMDKPTWKWTEPFHVDKETTTVRTVTARDQNYVVIIKVKKLSSVQMQVIIFGQLVVSNRLSQPVSMRLSHCSTSATSSTSSAADSAVNHDHHYTIQPGEHLPSLVASEILLNPIQFRLAGFSTSWSHDIYLNGDRMKDKHMVKIPLPDGSSYFHIWCRVFCQHFTGVAQKLVMLTPLYVVRVHLPRPLYIQLDSPKVKLTQEMTVKSQGCEFQLHCIGGDITHQMGFRLSPNMQLSSPSVVLSTGLIGQLTRSDPTVVNIEQMCEEEEDLTHIQWPYLTEEMNTGAYNKSDLTFTSQVSEPDPYNLDTPLSDYEIDMEPQPGIDLNVRLSEYIPGCDTLLVEVAPACLIHNATDFEVTVHGDENKEWRIGPNLTIAPPLTQTELKLTVKSQNITSSQTIIPISDESIDLHLYDDTGGRVLFIDGFVHSSVNFFYREANKTEMVFLTVTSDIQHGIRIICIRERFALTNESGRDLTAKLLALPLGTQPINMAWTETVEVIFPGKHIGKEDNLGCSDIPRKGPQPLFRWSIVETDNSKEEKSSKPTAGEATFVYYISFALEVDNDSSIPKEWRWSVPVRLISSKEGCRMTTSIPDHDKLEDNTNNTDEIGKTESMTGVNVPITHPVCVVTQQVKGVTHVVVKNDSSPVCVVENLCSFGIQFGQVCDKLRGNDAMIQEQMELVSDLPWVPGGGWCHYTPPIINSEFVTKEIISMPRMHLRAIGIENPDSITADVSEWSSNLQISGGSDIFVKIPNFCDLKIMIHMVGMVTHLIVRPVSKAEVTAKEIRSRIKDTREVKREAILIKPEESTGQFGDSLVKWKHDSDTNSSLEKRQAMGAASALPSETPLSPVSSPPKSSTPSGPFKLKHMAKKFTASFLRYSERKKQRKKTQKTDFTCGMLCNTFTVAVQDGSNSETLSELMCLHLRDLYLACYPVSRNPDSIGSETSFAVSLSSAQVDNMQYGRGVFDFPVIFLPQSKLPSSFNVDIKNNMSVLELHAVMRSKAFIHAQAVTFSDLIWPQNVTESVDIMIKPFSLYVDDTFVYQFVQEIETFTPSRLTLGSAASISTPGVLNRKLPAVVQLNSYTLARPITMKQLTIQPIKMNLSVHASLKLFLASDSTPLSLGKFERAQVYSTVYRLAHALTMHYASAAIFRAGIVVGSLEILGNPTGLVRSIGTGVSDLVSLPYSGLTRGPGAFVSGLSQGMGSLVRNVSAGMITSVTNFASSVSRNMDRLSFDSNHLVRQEENRRNRPVGVSDGLRQGLTGFGLSVLGAVAGIADQPIQTLISSRAQEERRSSATSTASGLVTGMGKGLVGVLTKPIGGAAEFVSQTGQGILHGTGLGQLHPRLETPTEISRMSLPNGQYKYSVKIFSSLPASELLLSVPAMSFDLMGEEVKVELLLTPDVLMVINVEEDAQQQALALSELECRQGYDTDGRLILQWMDHFLDSSSLAPQNSNKDRVAAFIDTQNATGQPMSNDLSIMYQSESKPQSPSQSESGVPTQSLSEPGLQNTNNQAETRKAEVSQPSNCPQYEFQMEPHWQDLFVTMFRLAKNKLQGRGFPI